MTIDLRFTLDSVKITVTTTTTVASSLLPSEYRIRLGFFQFKLELIKPVQFILDMLKVSATRIKIFPSLSHYI